MILKQLSGCGCEQKPAVDSHSVNLLQIIKSLKLSDSISNLGRKLCPRLGETMQSVPGTWKLALKSHRLRWQ